MNYKTDPTFSWFSSWHICYLIAQRNSWALCKRWRHTWLNLHRFPFSWIWTAVLPFPQTAEEKIPDGRTSPSRPSQQKDCEVDRPTTGVQSWEVRPAAGWQNIPIRPLKPSWSGWRLLSLFFLHSPRRNKLSWRWTAYAWGWDILRGNSLSPRPKNKPI